ncbi:MAG: inorganic diphosphatase [Alphaproteobacteria bacterium]|nr:inorganic diphosphatase [Alphaproteobacteria bacterium]MBN2780043.1 inorganic diphosphatase [Alphaproteobacteria bacterium]
MNLSLLPAGKDIPNDINVIIDVPAGSSIKYEFDKDLGAVIVDRFLHTPMNYPLNYGFIPHTLAEDGDPLDILVVSRAPVVPGSVIRCRPIGVLNTSDEAGQDPKILCVPHSKVDRTYDAIESYTQLPELLLEQITHFFERYKDLERGKWVKVEGWGDIEQARKYIIESVERAIK